MQNAVVLTITIQSCTIALSAFLAVYSYLKRGWGNIQNTLFLAMVLNGIWAVVFDTTSNIIIAYDRFHTPVGHQVMLLTNFLYFLVHILQPATYARYIMHVIGLAANTNWKYRLRFFAPAIFSEILLFINPYTKIVFDISDDFVFVRGPAEYILYGIGALYLVVSVYIIARYHNALRSRVLKAMIAYYVIVVVGVLIQLIAPVLTTELFFQALAFLGLMLTFEENGEELDETTRLRNETAFRWDNVRLLNTRRTYYILNIKIDNLKFYSRIMSGEAYDRLLSGIGNWVRTLRKNAEIYHFDNNYTLIIYNETEEYIRQLIEKIREMLEKSWYFDELEAHFRVFVSVAKVPDDIDTLDSIFDLVEYEKDTGGEHVLVQYRESLSEVRREAAIERALRKAIINRSFQVYFQPIYNCETERISCAEALVRLFDDELGQVPPAEFIPIAERSAMIVEIGDIVFEKVCRFIRDYHPSISGVEYVEINLSIAQFMFTGLVDRFRELTDQYGVRPSSINLEITESVATDSSESFMTSVKRLADLGFTFSMDDYGTGYSNIRSILNVDFKNIKMDKMFLTRALSDSESATVLKDTVSLIRHLRRNALQEGVETLEEYHLVREAGCNLVQGYFFSQPLPEADFMEYVRSLNQVAVV